MLNNMMMKRIVLATTVLLLLSLGLVLVAILNAQAFDFSKETCIPNASGDFTDGYYDAHLDVFHQQPYNQTAHAPTSTLSYDSRTGEKSVNQNATNDYTSGYKMGWKDAMAGKYYIDCG